MAFPPAFCDCVRLYDNSLRDFLPLYCCEVGELHPNTRASVFAAPLKAMQLEPGIVFKDPKTEFVWKISNPWMNRGRKKQLGWICKRIAPHPEQPPISNWFEHEIINLLEQGEP